MRAWISRRFHARGWSSSPSPSSGVMPRACLRMVRAGPAWHPRFRRGRCAREAHVRPGLRRAGPAGAAPRLSGASRQGARGLHRCAHHTDATSDAEVVNHNGHQRATHDAAGDENRERDSMRRAEAKPAAGDTRSGLPPRLIRQVAAERGAHRGPQLSIKGGQQVLVKKIPIDAHVILELGHVRALPGEDHRWGHDRRHQSRSAPRRTLAPTPTPVR